MRLMNLGLKFTSKLWCNNSQTIFFSFTCPLLYILSFLVFLNLHRLAISTSEFLHLVTSPNRLFLAIRLLPLQLIFTVSSSSLKYAYSRSIMLGCRLGAWKAMTQNALNNYKNVRALLW